MSKEIYRKLAQRLDAIPNGFPATESGVELRLLAKMFEPEEAALAAVMKLTKEPAADIAARAGVDEKTARRTLKQMVKNGLITAGRGEGELVYGLMPFAFGVYEYQLPRLDKEMAELFEAYYVESKAGIMRDTPSIHRVIPVEQAIPVDLEIFPYERATEMIENAKSWGARDCICRVQQKLVGKGCDAPIENCISFAPVEGAFDHATTMRPLTKEEALQILREAADAGLVHSTGNYRDGNHYICNCCTCCCGVLRGVAEFGMPTAVAHSDFAAVVDADLCIGCESCLDRCQFGALSVPDDLCTVDYGRCVGCGVCVSSCPVDALSLRRREEDERMAVPVNNAAWLQVRAQNRDISLSDVL
ncbi:MAG: 4Fe-4S binding protein [Anaerolineae bacterium]|nr:4Fe-4S binding protein [Anaerolineae bacterium]